jgi:hypothetical protein
MLAAMASALRISTAFNFNKRAQAAAAPTVPNVAVAWKPRA